MITSESIDKLAEALAMAQGEFEAVEKDKTNPHFKSKYASLASALDATRPFLSKHGLALIQAPEFNIELMRVVVITRLVHKSGQWIETPLSVKPAQEGPQALGSAITYLRRYSAEGVLGVAPEDADDDGNAAQEPKIFGNKGQPSTTEQLERERLRIELLNKEKEQREVDARKKAFHDKAIELGIDQKYWHDIAVRLKDCRLGPEHMQDVLNEMENSHG